MTGISSKALDGPNPRKNGATSEGLSSTVLFAIVDLLQQQYEGPRSNKTADLSYSAE
jgi:hypothetical protein